tara:strand:+ start:11083 stop:13386 length:2304 start_codon:yes stop_codon:yes gene_type:complete
MGSDTLIIVESNGKCQKIEKFTGHKCIASFGHVYALKPSLDWFDENNIEPNYIVINEKAASIAKLKKAAKSASKVIIASDLDREGEAIAANLMDMLSLNVETTDRITFNEISEKALKDALNNSGRLNKDLYNSQKARAVLDLVFGFTVSPILSRHLNSFALSAGRVQSPSLRLCMERQREQEVGEISINIDGEAKYCPKVNHIKPIIDKKEDVKIWLNNLKDQSFIVKDVKDSESKETPPPPFITSSLQQSAYNKHGFNPKHTMQIAQKLYEGGYITYMRTDSVTLSSKFQNDAKEWIIKEYGEKYSKPRQYGKKNNQKTQDAHEAIRPININMKAPSDSQEAKLYKLIKLRALASQMCEALYYVKKIYMQTDRNSKDLKSKSVSKKDEWESVYKKIKFDGYLKLMGSDSSDDASEIKHEIKKGDKLSIKRITVKEHAKLPPAPYNPASFVKTLEKSGIGRPSTYSSIIEKIQDKRYVIIGTNKVLNKELDTWELNTKKNIKESKYIQKIGGQKNVFVVTPLGERACEFFETSALEEIVSVGFTSKLENELDNVAAGKLDWKKVVSDFYKELQSKIKTLPKVQKYTKKDINWIHIIDTDKNGLKTGILRSLYGYSIAKEETGENDNKILKYAPMPPQSSPEEITKKQAEYMFNLPIDVNEKLKLKMGRYGWYVTDGNDSVSLGSETSPPSNKEIIEKFNNKSKNSSILKKIGKNWTLRQKNDSYYLMYSENGKKPSFYSVKDISGKWTEKRCQEIKKDIDKKKKSKK